MTTSMQKQAVLFCERWLNITFEGDWENFNDVSNFLSHYLDEAKSVAEDAFASYYSNFDY